MPSALMKCPIEFLTDHPIDVAVGSLAPQNGSCGRTGVRHSLLQRRRDISVNADVVATPGGAWRAGVYFKAVLTPVAETVVVPIGAAPAAAPDTIVIHPYPIIDGYVQTTRCARCFSSAWTGNCGSRTRRRSACARRSRRPRHLSAVHERRTRALNLSAVGEMNGRFVEVRSSDAQSVPDIATRYVKRLRPASRPSQGFSSWAKRSG